MCPRMVGTSQSNDWQQPPRRKPCLWPGTGRPSLPVSCPVVHLCLGQAEQIEWRSEFHKINQWVKECRNSKALQGSLACISGELTRALRSSPQHLPHPTSHPAQARERAVKAAPERQGDWDLGHPELDLRPPRSQAGFRGFSEHSWKQRGQDKSASYQQPA